MSAKTDQTTSYMRVACTDKKFIGINSCYDCHDKQYCEAYTLIMDLTAERNMCPLNPVMEKCVVDKIYLPHVLAPHKEGFSTNPEEVNKNRKLEQDIDHPMIGMLPNLEANRYEKASCRVNRYKKISDTTKQSEGDVVVIDLTEKKEGWNKTMRKIISDLEEHYDCLPRTKTEET